MSTRRLCDATSLEPAHLYPIGCFSGLKLEVVFELICIFNGNNVPSFFEHKMRFLCYFAALGIQINRFQSEGQA